MPRTGGIFVVVSLAQGLNRQLARSVNTPPEQTSAVERDRLVESHLPLVRAIARRYAGRGEALDDLVQAGAVGLVRASKRFDPDRGIAFSTFVTPAIEGEIRRHLGDNTTALRIPRELQRMAGELRRSRRELTGSLGRSPSADELAEALGVRRGDIELALEAEQARERVPGSAEVLESAAENEFSSSTEDRLSVVDSARVLDERERRIVFLRYHADMTERDIAQELGISQGSVSRLLSGALAKLREELDDEKVASSGADSASALVISPPERRAGLQEGSQAGADAPAGRGSGSRIPRVGRARQKADTTGRGNAAPGARATPKARGAKASGPSGRFLVRMPSELHQELTHAAEREQVSLNRFVTETLAQSLSVEPGAPSATGAPPAPARRRSFRMLVAANLVVIVVAAVAAVVLLVLALERGI